jgi:hypothetical protein
MFSINALCLCVSVCMRRSGGEFASPTQSQFKHYRDLWVFHLATNTWRAIEPPASSSSASSSSAKGGAASASAAVAWPSARSGHRMIAHKRKLVLFGGYTDGAREIRYHNGIPFHSLD